MKKISKLTALLAAGLLALGTFSFVSCSNDDDESSDTNNTPVTKEVTTTTNTITINGTDYTYTTVDGTPQASDSVTVSDDGTITITADDGSTLKIKGTSITYTTSDGKTYNGTSSDSSDSEGITLSGESGEISATSKSETKKETVSSDSEESGTVKELSFTDLEGKIFNYKDDDEDRWYKFEGGKVYKSSDKTYWSDKTSDWEEKGKSVALLNGTQYSVVEGKFLRTSGSGLYTTFSETFTEAGEPFKISLTLKNDGTCTITDPEVTETGTFTNNNGLIAITREGKKTLYGFYDGTSIYTVDDFLTEVTSDSASSSSGSSSGSTSEISVSGTVRELSYTDLEGKIFNYKDDDEDRWYKFEGGKVYRSSNKTSWSDKTSGWEEDGKSVALLNDTQYSVVGEKLPRTSGSGLYATFSETFTEAGESFTNSVTFKDDDTWTITYPGVTASGTFTNNNGLLVMTTEGETAYGFYDGTSFYPVGDLLTEVTSDSASSSSGSSSGSTSEISVSGTVKELSYTDLEGKIFNYKDDDEDRWYKFEGGKVYKSSDKTSWSDDTSDWEEWGESAALFNGTQYSVVRGKYPRTSGSGLNATFSGTFTEAGEPVTMLVTLKNDGTCTITVLEDTSSGTFTNNNGLLAMTTDVTIDFFYDGSYIYMVDKLLTEVTSDSASSSSGSSSGSTSEISVSGTVKELSFTDLEGKIFNYKKANGDDRWYKFEDGKVYSSSNKTSWSDKTSDWEEWGESVALFNGTQYSVVNGKFPRTSGSGLYATFSGTFTEAGEPLTILVTLKNDGTCTATVSEETVSGPFTNNNGFLAMTTEDGTIDWFYDGSYIYMVHDLLTEVTN